MESPKSSRKIVRAFFSRSTSTTSHQHTSSLHPSATLGIPHCGRSRSESTAQTIVSPLRARHPDAQVVETATETKKKPAVEKKKAKPTEPKAKKGKVSNGKKHPQTAFFLFMADFRKSFKEANPDCKSVATVML
ncbi:high mobility group B2 [Perilla frutescens var. frutescens]|nr:high mobility group B2 [Perilla frutescens var. frutescens]